MAYKLVLRSKSGEHRRSFLQPNLDKYETARTLKRIGAEEDLHKGDTITVEKFN